MKKLTKEEFRDVTINLLQKTLVPNICLVNTCERCYFDKDSFGCNVASSRVDKITTNYCGNFINFFKYDDPDDVDYNDHFYEIKTGKRRTLNTKKPIN